MRTRGGFFVLPRGKVIFTGGKNIFPSSSLISLLFSILNTFMGTERSLASFGCTQEYFKHTLRVL